MLFPFLGKSAPIKLYDQTIYQADTKNGLITQSVNDLKYYLQKSTGESFTVTSYNDKISKGIYVLLDKPGLLPPNLEQKLQRGTIEDFVISGNEDKLLLVATHPKGLSLAIYTYLDKLGVKWYFPGDEWTYIPNLSQITINSVQYVTPSFHLRIFAGTGGLYPIKSLDTSLALQRNWEIWKRRNRFGGAIQPSGHYGEAFNTKYKAELQKHPEYLAEVNGKRVPWSVTAKWNVSNENFRALFIQDRVNYLKDQLAKQRSSAEKIVISVEPADGYGDCECDSCKRLGSVSDRYFFLANEVAKAVAKISPLAYPNMYAYNTHAVPPSFDVEPNVIVLVIPYAFQKISSPGEMIKNWSERSKNLYIYDYYGIPDWHYDTPLTAGWSPDGLANKLKTWAASGIQGFSLETSYSIGSAGVGLYLASRLGWNSGENITAFRNAFYKNMFGAAEPYVKSYYEKINGNDFRGAADMPYLLELLNKATNATADAQVQSRIQKLQAYLHYLLLYYEWQSAAADQKNAAWENLVSYIWKIYPYAVVHSTRLAQLLFRKVPANSALAKSWSLSATPGTSVRSVQFLQGNELAALFKQDLKKYPLLTGFNYERMAPAISYSLKPVEAVKETNPQGMLLLAFPETLVRAGADGYARIMLKVNEKSAGNLHQTVLVQCIDTTNGKQVYSEKLDIVPQWKTVIMKLPANKAYRFVVGNKNWIRMYVPQDQWAGFRNIPGRTEMGKLWFYVPAGTTYVYYSTTPNITQPPIFDEAGKPLTTEKVNDQGMYRVIVKAASSGQWCSIMATQNKNLQFYQVPDLFFSHPNYAVTIR